MSEETDNRKTEGGAPISSSELVSRLEKTVKYYERMHADARKGIEIAMAMSAEMKERRIEAQIQLERAKSANDKLTDAGTKTL